MIDSEDPRDEWLEECAGLPPVITDRHIEELYNLANRRAAQKFIRKHGIPHQRLGRHYSIVLADFLDWLRDRTETGVDDDLIDDMYDEIVGADDEEDYEP